MPRVKRQHLKRQKDGYFYCRFQGKTFRGKTEDEAFAKREEFKRQGLTITPQTVAQYAEYWLPIHKASVKASTYNAYLSILTAVLQPIAGVYLHALTSDHIAEALATLSGKSASYIHKARILLIEILDSATDAGYIPKNPARAKSVKPPKGTRGTHRAITPAERSAIEKTNHRMRLAALIMLYCGLRRGELLGLKAEDIAGESLTVRRAVYFVSNQPVVADPKTIASVRTVPAPDFILRLMPKMDRGCYVLTGTQKPMTEQVFTRAWANFCEAAGITVRCHDLRHSYCTWLRDSGIDMHQAIIWMGHADEKMILRVYDHPGQDRETNAKNALFAALSLQNGLHPNEKEPSALTE